MLRTAVSKEKRSERVGIVAQTWVPCLTIGAEVISGNGLNQIVQGFFVARLLALAQYTRHGGKRCEVQRSTLRTALLVGGLVGAIRRVSRGDTFGSGRSAAAAAAPMGLETDRGVLKAMQGRGCSK